MSKPKNFTELEASLARERAQRDETDRRNSARLWRILGPIVALYVAGLVAFVIYGLIRTGTKSHVEVTK